MTDWYADNFKSKGHIEINESATVPYLLELHRIDGLKIKSNIEVSLVLYDSGRSCCYGSMWRSLSIAPPFTINQDLVFHADITASTILFLEVIRIDGDYKKSAIGWTCFNLLDKNAVNKKHNLFHGSLRAVFLLPEPSVNSTQLLRCEGVTVSLSLTQRNVVRNMTSHVPSNYFHPPAPLNKLNKTTTPISIFLENVEVSFGSHIQKFEENLLFLLLNDAKQQNSNIRQFDKASIKERRLKASIHNGLNFTDQFQVVYLENIHNTSLKSKGVISLTNVDPRNVVVFSLEYVLEVPVSFTNLTLISSMRNSQVHIVTLRWGVWTLGKNVPSSGSLLNVPIVGGPGLNPEKKLVFTSDYGPMDTNKEAAVMFRLIKQEADVAYLSREALDATITSQLPRPDLEVTFDGPAPTTHLAPPPHHSTPYHAATPQRGGVTTESAPTFDIPTIEVEEVSKKQRAAPKIQAVGISAGPLQPTDSLVGENPAQFDIKPSFQQDIRPQDLEKAAYAEIHNAAFPDIVDNDGRPAMELDLSKHYVYSAALEKNDSRTCNSVVFQFLAVSFSNNSPVRNMFFTVQFYCFPAETTPILRAQQSRSDLPAILYKQDNAGQTPGCNVSFTVDPGKLANEPNQFLAHIQTGACLIDMWNADSLFHVGSVNVKLKRLARQGEHGIQSTQVFNIIRDGETLGKLHLRIANVGSVPALLDGLKSSTVIDCVDKMDASELVLRPKTLSTIDQNLTSILASETVQKVSRNRKLERMEAVRRAQDASYIIPRDENKELRSGQLTMIKNYRNKILNDVIRESLVSKITRHHQLYTVYGSATYFEVHYRNTASTVQDYSLTWDAPDIRLVYDTTECKALKSLFNVSTPLDADVFKSSSQPAKLTLRPNEDIYIPFVYSSNTTKEDFTYTMKISNHQNSPVQLIKLHFKQQRQTIHERYMFYEAENTFAKHTLVVPHTARGSAGKHLNVRCSEETVLCGVDTSNNLFFKAPVPASTEKMTFLLLLYIDELCYRPYQIWEVEIHSLKRLDMSAVVGSRVKFPVILRGTDTTRCVTCFSSTPRKLQVEPEREFMLLPSTIQEVKLLFEPTETGVANYMVNVVDTKNKVIVEQWIVHTSATLPIVSKTYDIEISTTLVPVHKNISFTNPYSTTRTFRLKTNKPELVQFKESELSVPSKESVNIGLVLTPICLAQSNYILVFVNDVDHKCEECFALRIG